MKHFTLYFAIITLLCSCSDSVSEQDSVKEDSSGQYLPVHEKIRSTIYPKITNEIYVNPPPLIVPQDLRDKSKTITFYLSKDPNFASDKTIKSGPTKWNIFNAHQKLEPGLWYWRYIFTNDKGVEQESPLSSFMVEAGTPEFVTPDFGAVHSGLTASYPRLYKFLEQGLDANREHLNKHPEYRALRSRANTALAYDLNKLTYTESEISQVKFYSTHLYDAYMVTQEKKYLDKLLEISRKMLATPISDEELFKSNFFSTDLATIYLNAYDLGQEDISGDEKTQIESLLSKISRFYYKQYMGMQENHILIITFGNITYVYFFKLVIFFTISLLIKRSLTR